MLAFPCASGGAEPHRADQPGHIGYIGLLLCNPCQFAFLDQLCDHEKPRISAFASSKEEIFLFHGFANITLARDGILDPQSVGNFMEHHISKESIKFDIARAVPNR